jgi:hypothetical protein
LGRAAGDHRDCLGGGVFQHGHRSVVDLASPAKHPLAETGKDVGAAAVLIAALAAAGIGLLILGPPLWEQISVWLGN